VSTPPDPADELLDDTDAELIARYGRLLGILDPPPPELDVVVGFAVDLEPPDAEVARPDRWLAGAGARGSGQSTTFHGETLTVMVTPTRTGDLVRLDGWLAPGAPLRIELHVLPHAGAPPDRPPAVVADADGRFLFEDLPPGMAKLVVHREGLPPVTTPALEL
jgi:hypothetical protein